MVVTQSRLKEEKKSLSSCTTYPTGILQYSKELSYSGVNPLALFFSLNIPVSHKKVARNYLLIKKIFGTQVIISTLLQEEEKLLKQFGFHTLNRTTSQEMYEEISFLQKWSLSKNEELKLASDMILQIRNKELKNLISSNFNNINKKEFNGYHILEKYFASIA